jgi:CheY-like chemotaxis protein
MHILLIDDVIEISVLLRMVFEYSGCEVTTGSHGIDGLRILDSITQPPDLIVADVRMPHMDGYTFLRKVRARPGYDTVRFLLISVDRDAGKNALASGADAFLAKPFSLNDLDLTMRGMGLLLPRSTQYPQARWRQ